MVSAPNSLSMNAVNFQKAKSAPLVIKKNISTTPVQINKKTIDEGTMRKMLDEADQSGVDKGEIIQGLLDRGYDIEEPKTFMQKAGQIGKNIVGGTLGGLPALGPNLLGGAMKGLGSLGVAPGLPAQTKITQGMKDVGQELISRGEQARNITEKALGANPNDTSTQLARSVVPIASQIIASGPLGLTKAGAGAFQTAKAGIAARSLPTIAKGVAQGALVGGTEQAMFDVAQTGETTPGNIALGATIGGALPVAVPLIQKGIKEGVKGAKFLGRKAIAEPLNSLANKLYTSGLLNPKKLEYVTDALREEGDQVDNVVNWMYERGVKGGKTEIVDQLEELAKGTRGQVKSAVASFDDLTQNNSVRGALDEIAEALGDPKSQKQISKLNQVQELIKKHDTTGLSRAEVQKVKEDMDEVLNIYTLAGDVKAGQKKVDLAGLRQELRKLIEDRGLQEGIDLRTLNRDTAVAKKLSEGINYKDKADFVREILSPFASPFAGGAIGATQGDTMEERVKNAVVGAIIGRVAGSTALKTNAGFYMKKVGDFFSKLPASDKATLSLLINKLDDVQGSSNGIDDIGSIPTSSKSMLDTVLDSVPNAKGLAKKMETFIDDTTKTSQTLPPSTKAPLVQSTKTAPKLPVAKKTPLKQASESVNVAPKKVQALQALDATNPKQELMNRVIDNEQAVRKVIEETNPTLPKVKIDDFIERAKQGRAGTDEMVKEILKKLDTPKLSPKTPKVLKVPTPLSKVDDALPVGEKMGNTTQSAKSLESADLTTSIKKAKAEGKTFDEFVKGKKIYHGTNQTFDDFDFTRGGNATKQMPSAKGNVFFTKDLDEARAYAKAANKNQIVDEKSFDDWVDSTQKKIEDLQKKGKRDEATEIENSFETEYYKKINQLQEGKQQGPENIMERIIDPQAIKVIDINGEANAGKLMEIFDKAKKEGYLGVELRGIIDAPTEFFPNNKGTTQYAVWDKKALLSEAQLRTERDKLDNTGLPALGKTTSKVDDGLIAEASKKYLINGKAHTLENIKASGAYKSIIESLNNLGVKGWTDDDIIAMLKKTQKPNTTNADRNRAITEIENKYPRNIKPGKDDLPF